MEFGEDHFESLLPPYLTSDQKSRLKDSLSQFSIQRGAENPNAELDYNNFTNNQFCNYFKQSDLVYEIRYPHLNEETVEFEKYYTTSIILSNTCDISNENSHTLNRKQSILAPIIDLNSFIEDLKNNDYFTDERLSSFLTELKLQRITNLFYISNNGGEEYIALLDKIFWFPTDELNSYIEDINENKLFSLTQFGYYLFLLKLSFHFCRFPEALDRAV
ncbi:hypothetical protein [Flavobacterium sp. GSP14]|uniref:hypothetical protein n=1 Tax=Flavobacterium sp. GSP14 TaxID=3401734 RepID=UPI003AAB7C38